MSATFDGISSRYKGHLHIVANTIACSPHRIRYGARVEHKQSLVAQPEVVLARSHLTLTLNIAVPISSTVITPQDPALEVSGLRHAITLKYWLYTHVRHLHLHRHTIRNVPSCRNREMHCTDMRRFVCRDIIRPLCSLSLSSSWQTIVPASSYSRHILKQI